MQGFVGIGLFAGVWGYRSELGKGWGAPPVFLYVTQCRYEIQSDSVPVFLHTNQP